MTAEEIKTKAQKIRQTSPAPTEDMQHYQKETARRKDLEEWRQQEQNAKMESYASTFK